MFSYFLTHAACTHVQGSLQIPAEAISQGKMGLALPYKALDLMLSGEYSSLGEDTQSRPFNAMADLAEPWEAAKV